MLTASRSACTALRIVYGSPRFSEDLDFSGFGTSVGEIEDEHERRRRPQIEREDGEVLHADGVVPLAAISEAFDLPCGLHAPLARFDHHDDSICRI
jgi:hypothetical protein